MRASRAGLVALLVAAMLGGCLGGQGDGRVRPGLDINAPGGEPAIYLPPGPQVGAAPESIIRGFLRAGAVTGDAITVAQSFLTRSATPRWNPDLGTVVIGGENEVKVVDNGDGRYAVSASLVGRIDARGRYSRASTAAEVTMSVRLVSVEGQWRLTELPGDFGRWMTQGGVRQLLQPVAVHYVAASSDALIPDVRWLSGDRLATRLVRAQLGAVPNYLEGAARTDLGGGVKLVVDAVPVVDGIATVDLGTVGLPTDVSARRNIWAQLVATLLQAPNVVAVEVAVEGAPLELPGVSGPVSSLSQWGLRTVALPSEADSLLRIGARVYPVDLDHVLEPGLESLTAAGSTFPAISGQWTNLARSFVGNEIAAVSVNGTALARWHPTGALPPAVFASRLTRPTYDRTNVLWVGGLGSGANASARLWALNAAVDPTNGEASTPYPVEVVWLSDRVVRSVDVSLDGLRVAIVSTDSAGVDARLDVAGINRRPNGLPVALAAVPMRLAAHLVDIRDATWISPTELGVLGRDPQEAEGGPFFVTLGDDTRKLSPLEGAHALTTLGGERGLALITANSVALRAGTRWITLPSATDLAVPAR